MLSILGTIVVGLIVGLIARALKPGNDSMGFIMTTLLGIAGAFAAKYAGIATGFYEEGDVVGWIASIVGAIVLLLIYGLVTKKSS